MPTLGPRTGTRAKKALPFILAFFVVLMIASSYSNTLTSPPYLDDFHSFIYVKALYLHSLSLSSLLSLSQTRFGWTRFLPVVTFALNHYLGHSNLIYFHVVNILIHLLAFFAVFWFVRLVLAAEKKKRPWDKIPYEAAGLFPLCVAAIWALSPVQTSAVTYLVQRMASMQALFFTLSAACFIKARLFAEKKMRAAVLFYFLCALTALCAFLSKENSAALPVALVLIDIWFFDSAWLKKAWAACRKTGWKVRSAAAALILSSSFYAFTVVLPKLLSGYSYRDFTLTERLLTEGRVVVWYMSLLLWPAPARLAMEHDPRISTSLFSPATTLPALLLIAALIFLAIWFRKRFPAITFGIVWFFLNLVIESTIIPLELVFEHRLYLPSVGFYLSAAALLTILLRWAAKRLPEAEFAKAACSLLLIGAACFAILTFVRNGVWKNTITIHYDTAAKAPDSPRANADYANTLCAVGRYKEALKYAEKALKLDRKGHEAAVLAQNALTIALIKEGKTDEAIERDEKFVKDKIDDVNGDALPNLGLNVAQACIAEKKPKEAYKWILRALKYAQLTDDGSLYKKGLVEAGLVEIFSRFDPREVDPGLDEAFESLGSGTSPATGPREKACRPAAAPAGQMTVAGAGVCGVSMSTPRRGPGVSVRSAILAAMVFKSHGDEQYARGIIEREYAKNPDNPLLKAETARFRKEDAQNLAQKKKWNVFQKYVRSPFSRFNFDMAVAYLVQKEHLPKFFQGLGENRLDAALKISPGSSDAWLLKAWYLYNDNEADHAVKAVRKVLAGDPENSNAWLALGFFLDKAGNANGAVAAFKKVIELYPGYSRRALVEEFCSLLKKGKPIESASNRK